MSIVDERQIVGDKESSHVLVKCGGKKYAAEVKARGKNAYFILQLTSRIIIVCLL